MAISWQILNVLKRGLGILLVAVSVWTPAAHARQTWIQVDTQALTLTVFSAENHVLARFNNISIGSGGAAEIHRRGDETTPLGTFRIARIDRHSRFGTFYGLDYPSADMAQRAFSEGIISRAELDAIIEALRQHRIPPQNTPLGGQLGIHGIGSGDPGVHQDFNWTNGCVALSNRQIRQLSRWIHVGTRVIIR
jgi:murein L,D-transpeptidase YafK